MGESKYSVRESWIQSLLGGVDEEEYSVYSKFDKNKHKERYKHYLEVIIDRDGIVHYAVPSHQEKLIKMACEELKVDRDGLNQLVPEDYYFDMVTWLCMVTGSVSVWTQGLEYATITDKHYQTLKMLQDEGIYEGSLPDREEIPLGKIIRMYEHNCTECAYLDKRTDSCTSQDYIKHMYEVCCVWHHCRFWKKRGEGNENSND